jgi:hypothetical protein
VRGTPVPQHSFGRVAQPDVVEIVNGVLRPVADETQPGRDSKLRAGCLQWELFRRLAGQGYGQLPGTVRLIALACRHLDVKPLAQRHRE